MTIPVLKDVEFRNATDAPADVIQMVEEITDICNGKDFFHIHSALYSAQIFMLKASFGCTHAQATRIVLEIAQKSAEKSAY